MVGSDGDRWIATQNIMHFQAKLDDARDDNQRRILRDLIEREKEKLAKLRDQKPS